MKTILVPTDFSSNAATALDYAAALAQKSGARIMIVHSCSLLDDRFARNKALIREANEAQTADLKEALNGLKADIDGRWNVPCSAHLFNSDDITETILQTGEEDADLIVLGTHGKTGLRRRLFGSKAADVINRSSKPVLIIPPDYQLQAPEKILVAVAEGSQRPETFAPVFELAGIFGSRVYLTAFARTETEADEFVVREQHLQGLRDQLAALHPGVAVETVTLVGDAFQDAIPQYIKEADVRLLTMATRERDFWDSLFDGSLTQQMSYVTNVPLLCLRLPAQRR